MNNIRIQLGVYIDNENLFVIHLKWDILGVLTLWNNATADSYFAIKASSVLSPMDQYDTDDEDRVSNTPRQDTQPARAPNEGDPGEELLPNPQKELDLSGNVGLRA